jgi:hypothetical protein
MHGFCMGHFTPLMFLEFLTFIYSLVWGKMLHGKMPEASVGFQQWWLQGIDAVQGKAL